MVELPLLKVAYTLAARLGDRADIYIDAFDTFAEDYGKINAMKLARRLLKITLTRKGMFNGTTTQADPPAPSRLVISIASSSGIYQSLLTPTFCSSLTHIQPLSPDLLRYISHTYLKTVSSDPAFLSLVERALARRLPEYFASHAQKFLTVVMTVRKATGGAKAMLRNVAAFDSETCSVMELDKLLLYDTLGTSSNVPTSRPSTHADLGIPFNLSITDDQRQRRDAIPVPYVHEGEGVELGWEEEEEDDDDEEI